MKSTPNFDRIARAYRWCEYLALGPLLQRMRCHFLPQVKHARCALVLGDGDGRFTARLLAQNSDLEALAVDTSARMLHLLRKRCRAFAPRLKTLQQSALTADASRETDIIVTHFFLDCLTQPEVECLTVRLATQTQRGTLWLLSDFAVPDKPMLRGLARLYIRSLYFSFRLLTGLQVRQLPQPQRAIADAGFKRIARHQTLWGVLYTELWERK
jgi:SAM-dependent methyltransferase